MNSISISKFISYLLRHDQSFLSAVDAHGWVKLDALLARLDFQGTRITMDDLAAMNEASEKRRWEIDRNRGTIRATHGHSISIAPVSIPAKLPDYLYHGTSCASVPSIMRTGLLPMSRGDVHLSADFDSAVNIGKRHGLPFVIHVNTFKMNQYGITPICTSEGVWLSPAIPPSFLQFNGWTIPDSESATLDTEELRIEVPSNHKLFSVISRLAVVFTLAPGADDRIFEDLDTGMVYEIHLTYRGKEEPFSGFPHFDSYSSFEDWVRTRVTEEAGDFA